MNDKNQMTNKTDEKEYRIVKMKMNKNFKIKDGKEKKLTELKIYTFLNIKLFESTEMLNNSNKQKNYEKKATTKHIIII